jgi:hypothetical protein
MFRRAVEPMPFDLEVRLIEEPCPCGLLIRVKKGAGKQRPFSSILQKLYPPAHVLGGENIVDEQEAAHDSADGRLLRSIGDSSV